MKAAFKESASRSDIFRSTVIVTGAVVVAADAVLTVAVALNVSRPAWASAEPAVMIKTARAHMPLLAVCLRFIDNLSRRTADHLRMCSRRTAGPNRHGYGG